MCIRDRACIALQFMFGERTKPDFARPSNATCTRLIRPDEDDGDGGSGIEHMHRTCHGVLQFLLMEDSSQSLRIMYEFLNEVQNSDRLEPLSF